MSNAFPRRIAILGSTGSIGTQTLDVANRLPHHIEVVAVAANRNVSALIEQAEKYKIKHIGVYEAASAKKAELPSGAVLHVGMNGLCEIAALPEVDAVVVAVAGMIGLQPTITAIQAGKNIALASKEVLVAAGEIVAPLAKACESAILPIDSEHSALLQCLQGYEKHQIEKLILTASGGPFLNTPSDLLASVKPEDALKHPNWDMGALVTINSATLMNKGLEVIEARWLFDVKPENIEVVIHPQSIIHSMVQYKDGSILAQLGLPDMRLPIQYALIYPERFDTQLPRLDITEQANLAFIKPSFDKFPCLKLAYEALQIGKTAPAVMNGANEAAVGLFLSHRIGFSDIADVVSRVVEMHNPAELTLENILSADSWAREMVGRLSNV